MNDGGDGTEPVESTESLETTVELRPVGRSFRRVVTNNRNVDNNIAIEDGTPRKPDRLADLARDDFDD